MAGTVVTPVDAFVRFHHYTVHFPDDYDIDGATATALLTLSGASETEIRNFFNGLAGSPRDQDAKADDTTTTLVSTGADSSGLLTPSAPVSAGCTSGGLGAQDATASDRVTESLCAPSPTPHDDTGLNVPKTSDGDRPCARRLELNEKDDAEAPNFGASAKEGEEPDEDACVDDAEVGKKAIDDLDDDDLHMVLAISCHIRTHDLSPHDVSNILARPTFEGKVISQPLRAFYDEGFVQRGYPTPATILTLPYDYFDDDAHDHDDAQSPPPLNHPHTWNLGASAPSEDLGTPQSNGMGAGMADKDAAPADAEDPDKACGLPIPATTLPNAQPDHDDAQSPPPLNHPHTWNLGASAPSEGLGTPQSNGMGAGMAGQDVAPADHDKACGLPLPATTLPAAHPDHDDAQSPLPLNHPPTWNLGASAPSEDLGTPQSNGMGAGIAGRDTAAAAADAEDTAADARGLTPTEFGAEDAPGPEDEAEEEAEEEEEKEDDEDEDDEEGDENVEEDKEAAEDAGPDAAEEGEQHDVEEEDEDDAAPATVH